MAKLPSGATRGRKSALSPQSAGRSLPKGKAWGGRFAEPTDRLVEQFTASLSFDQRLYPYDIQGSVAHCRTLQRAGVFTARESAGLIRGLQAVKAELDGGVFPFSPQDEDIHMAIERRLTELIGPLGGKLHTGRSRNDQVALDLRLFFAGRPGHPDRPDSRISTGLGVTGPSASGCCDAGLYALAACSTGAARPSFFGLC